jgi:hypothetical protein
VSSREGERPVQFMFEAQNVLKMQYCCLDRVANLVLEMIFENGLRDPKFQNQVLLLDTHFFINT